MVRFVRQWLEFEKLVFSKQIKTNVSRPGIPLFYGDLEIGFLSKRHWEN